jgi:hypothetical protein
VRGSFGVKPTAKFATGDNSSCCDWKKLEKEPPALCNAVIYEMWPRLDS